MKKEVHGVGYSKWLPLGLLWIQSMFVPLLSMFHCLIFSGLPFSNPELNVPMLQTLGSSLTQRYADMRTSRT